MLKQILVKCAREGDPTAITALLNRDLQKHNITARVDVKGQKLKVLFEADKVPSQEKVSAFMQKFIDSIQPETISEVNIYGKAFHQDNHEWEQKFEIQGFSDFHLPTTEDIAEKTRDIAKAHIVSAEVKYDSPFLPTQKIENQEISNSAYCPNCGSSHLQLRRDTNVSWGRAVVGWALFGAIGGAVGAVTGEDRNAIACLNCGTTWKAEDLYKIKKTIKELTGKNLILSREDDRNYMNSFISEVGPYLEDISKVEKTARKTIENSKSKESQNTGNGCAYGCAFSLIMIFTALPAIGSIGLMFGIVWFLLAFSLPVIGIFIGQRADKSNREKVMREIALKEAEVQKTKANSVNKMKAKLRSFIASH